MAHEKETEKKLSRSLKTALKRGETVSKQFGVPENVKERALSLYRKAFDRNLVKGRSRNGFLAAAFAVGYIEIFTSEKLEELADLFDTSYLRANRAYKILVSEFPVSLPSISEWVERLLGRIYLREEIKDKALKAAAMVENMDVPSISCLSRKGLASAVIYLVCVRNDFPLSMRGAGEIAGVSRTTVQSTVLFLEKELPSLKSKSNC